MTASSQGIRRIGLGGPHRQHRGIHRFFRAVQGCLPRHLPRILLVLAAIPLQASDRAAGPSEPAAARPEHSIVFTQLPGTSTAPGVGGTLRSSYGEGSRLAVIGPEGSIKPLSAGFHSAADPDVSFDGARILFAGKRRAADHWNIFEMNVDGSGVRQITRDLGDCRSPSYQSTLYTIVSPAPWYQLTFVASIPGALNECGSGPATSLYSCKLDGTAVRQLTFNLSSDMDPYLLPDGRLVFASWQRAHLNNGPWGRLGLFGINIDGTDCAAFCTEQGSRVKQMPCVTAKGRVVFVEADAVPWHGGGTLGSVTTRRPLHSYRPLTRADQGWFHSPSPLPDGRILVSRMSSADDGTYSVHVLDPESGHHDVIFDDPHRHDIQAKAICARSEPDGRSSVVTEEDPHGKLYCLSVYTNDFKDRQWLPRGSVKRLRVLEGIPVRDGSRAGVPAVAQRRILGEVPVAADGSFNIEIPANTPIELQILDDNGMALRRCGWIWAKNHEPRGCIGCHEDGELTPENVLADALTRPSVKLTLPPERRRTVDFRRDVVPVITAKCVPCHGRSGSPMHLTAELSPVAGANDASGFSRSYESLFEGAEDGCGRYVHSGRARTSPLVWRLHGRHTGRPWDETAAGQAVAKMPPDPSPPLTEQEKRTFVEWIDLGALWDGIPPLAGPSAHSESKGN